jgi:hypothetical protein
MKTMISAMSSAVTWLDERHADVGQQFLPQ